MENNKNATGAKGGFVEAEWEELSGVLVKFENIGDEVTGEYIASEARKGDGDKADNIIYSVRQHSDGKVVSFFGSAVLNSRMKLVPTGATVRILYEDKQPATDKSKNDTKIFRVWVKKGKA